MAIEHGPVEIVDFSMKHGGSFHSYVTVDQRVTSYSNRYPLVNCYTTMERSTMLLMGKSTISMVIFNSYVKLPEGIVHWNVAFPEIFLNLHEVLHWIRGLPCGPPFWDQAGRRWLRAASNWFKMPQKVNVQWPWLTEHGSEAQCELDLLRMCLSTLATSFVLNGFTCGRCADWERGTIQEHELAQIRFHHGQGVVGNRPLLMWIAQCQKPTIWEWLILVPSIKKNIFWWWSMIGFPTWVCLKMGYTPNEIAI